MNHTAFFEQVKKGNIQPVYLMEGTEEYIKQQAVRQLCTKLLPAGLEELNLTDLTDPEADALIAAAETLPFMADRRIVIIRECSLLTAGKKAENEDKAAQIAEYVERIPDPEGQVMKLYLTGLDAEAIADNMQLSIRTVYNVKSRAVGMLKKFFSLSNE